MNTAGHARLKRLRRRLLMGGIAGVAVMSALSLVSTAGVPAACRFAGFACIAPAIGSVLFALIHELTGGRWGEPLKPFFSAGAQLAPWIWLIVVPLLFLHPGAAPTWPAYESRAMLLIRAIIYAAAIFAVARPFSRPDRMRPAAWVGPAGLIGLVFTLHLLAEDWLASLEPGWHSTAFPLVWMTGLAVAGLACAVIFALVGGLPPQSVADDSALGIDWGNLLLAAMLFWCYVAFAQFLIIWAGNLPREIPWFEHRAHGVWKIVPLALVLLHFVVPLIVLLSRRWKRSPQMLGAVAGVLLFAQSLYAAWMILPAFHLDGWLGVLVPVAALAGTAGLFLNLYVGVALRRLEKQ